MFNAISLCAFIASVVLLAFHIFESPMRQLAEDGGGYLHTALTYAEEGRWDFPAGREPGYRLLILLVSLVSPWASLQDLASNVILIQIIVYVLLTAALAREAWLQGGAAAAAVVTGLIALDRFNLQWMFDVQSEAPSRLFAFGGLLLMLVGLRRRRSWVLLVGLLALGLIPLMRPSDIAVPWTAALGVVIWALLRRERHAAYRAAAMLTVIAAPVVMWSIFHGVSTGYFGITERSAWHLAGRTLTVIPPDILRRGSVDPEYIEQVAVPIYDEYGAQRDLREPLVDDLGRKTPLSRLITPSPRHEPPALTGKLLESRGERPTDHTVAAFLDRQSRSAIATAPTIFIEAIAPIVLDFAYLPIAKPLYDVSIRNKTFLIIPLFWLGATIVLVFCWPRIGPVQRAALFAAVFLLPVYWVGCSVAGYYAVRFGTLQHLTATLIATFAAIPALDPQRAARQPGG